MAIQFTPAQAAAITARGGSLLVSAAAGSGKTRVLVERVVGMMTDPTHPVEPDSLLIMTFTNAAAAKLRADIAARLREVPGSERLRLRLQRASIGTVDAFCLHFVQEHFAVLDIPPDFETAEEADLYRLRQEVLAEVLEDAYRDPEFRAFADLYDRGRTDGTAGAAVWDLYAFAQTLPHPKQTLEAFAAMWQTDDAPQDTVWGQALLQAAGERAAGAQELLEAALRCAEREENAAAAYAGVLADDLCRIDRLREVLRAGDWDDCVALLETDNTWARAGRIKGGKAGNPAAFAASELRARAKKLVESLRGEFLLCTAAEFNEDRRRAAPLVAALARVAQDFSDRYFAAKLSEKLLDYADYEHLTLDLLITPEGERTELCKTVSARYSAVLVDEYQDTNALQDAIYFALAAPDASNLFFVGDIKQSIYRFRQADPSVFLAKQAAWGPYPQGPGQPASIALDANFRSAARVIEGVNYLFGVVFSAALGGVDYGPGQRLVVGRDDPGYPGHCELDVIRHVDVAGDARAVAARIAELLTEGFLVRGKEGTRPCTAEDFCILLRGRAEFELYAAALQARGIPVYADTAQDLLDAPAVRPFAALLRVLDNPAQDIPLAAVLLSPIFGYTADDLVALRVAVPDGSLYGALLNGDLPRFAPFLETMARYRRLARTMPVDALIEELFARTGYLAAVGAMPGGEDCRDALRGFAAWAAGAGRAGLPSLIRAMDAAQSAGGVSANSGGAGQTKPGCVSIMTVHRSKGLEFPIVFVANTSHRFNNADIIQPVLRHRELGVGLTLRDGEAARRYKTLPYAALAQAIRRENASEEMRVLYVALTRAQDALFITVPLREPESELKTPALCAAAEATGAGSMQNASCWAAWLLTAALLHPGSDALWQDTPLLPHHIETDAPLVIRVCDAPEPLPEREPAPDAMPDATLTTALLQSFGWRSPDEALQGIPAKVSVTAVTHAAAAPTLERPAFLQAEGMTGAERGTAIHAFMQSVPLDEPGDFDLEAEIQRQTARQLIDPVLAETLDRDRLRPFFAGAVWRRIRTAREILREEPFITALPAGEIEPGAKDSAARVLVQGIADLVLVFDGYAEILDYKTDRSRDPAYYQRMYGAQLRLYRRAFAMRLPVPVTKLTIYSFTLAEEIDIALEGE